MSIISPKFYCGECKVEVAGNDLIVNKDVSEKHVCKDCELRLMKKLVETFERRDTVRRNAERNRKRRLFDLEREETLKKLRRLKRKDLEEEVANESQSPSEKDTRTKPGSSDIVMSTPRRRSISLARTGGRVSEDASYQDGTEDGEDEESDDNGGKVTVDGDVENTLKDLKYAGDRRFRPGQPFDDGMRELEKESRQDARKAAKLQNLKRFIASKKLQIVNELREEFGTSRPLRTKEILRKREVYEFKCPVHGCHNKWQTKLKRHLTSRVHSWSEDKAEMEQSRYVRMYKYITRIYRKGIPFPQPCITCHKYIDRLDRHLKEATHQSNVAKKVGTKKTFVTTSASRKASRKEMVEKDEEIVSQCTSTSTNIGSKVTISTHTKRDDVSTNELNEQTNEPSVIIRAHNEKADDTIQKVTILKHATALTPMMCKQISADDSLHRYWYTSAENLLLDFRFWLIRMKNQSETNAQQIVNRVSTVWKAVDPTMCLYPNKLGDGEEIEDVYLSNKIQYLRKYFALPMEERDANTLQASTIESRIRAIELLIKFSKARYICIGISEKRFESLRHKITEWAGLLRPLKEERKHELDDYKLKMLITRSHYVQYGTSRHVKDIEKLVQDIKEGKMVPTEKEAISIRNYLVFRVTMMNACRASNIVNISIKDVNDAVASKEDFPNAVVIWNKKYKTSLIYGKKAIVLDNGLWQQLQIFITQIRVVYCKDDEKDDYERFLFSSSRKSSNVKHYKLTPSGVCNILSETWRSAGMSKVIPRISPTVVRYSIVTDYASLGNNDLESFANIYMKHRLSTCLKYYVLRWSEREAVRIAMEVGERWSGDEDSGQKVKSMVLKRVKVAGKRKVKQWLESNEKTIKLNEADVDKDFANENSDVLKCLEADACSDSDNGEEDSGLGSLIPPRNEDEVDFSLLHTGGNQGSRLKSVNDLVRGKSNDDQSDDPCENVGIGSKSPKHTLCFQDKDKLNDGKDDVDCGVGMIPPNLAQHIQDAGKSHDEKDLACDNVDVGNQLPRLSLVVDEEDKSHDDKTDVADDDDDVGNRVPKLPLAVHNEGKSHSDKDDADTIVGSSSAELPSTVAFEDTSHDIGEGDNSNDERGDCANVVHDKPSEENSSDRRNEVTLVLSATEKEAISKWAWEYFMCDGTEKVTFYLKNVEDISPLISKLQRSFQLLGEADAKYYFCKLKETLYYISRSSVSCHRHLLFKDNKLNELQLHNMHHSYDGFSDVFIEKVTTEVGFEFGYSSCKDRTTIFKYQIEVLIPELMKLIIKDLVNVDEKGAEFIMFCLQSVEESLPDIVERRIKGRKSRNSNDKDGGCDENKEVSAITNQSSLLDDKSYSNGGDSGTQMWAMDNNVFEDAAIDVAISQEMEGENSKSLADDDNDDGRPPTMLSAKDLNPSSLNVIVDSLWSEVNKSEKANDWFKTRSLDRAIAVTLVYLCRNILPEYASKGKTIPVEVFRKTLNCNQDHPFIDFIEKIQWQSKLKDVLRNMCKKYKKDHERNDLSQYDSFVHEGRVMQRKYKTLRENEGC